MLVPAPHALAFLKAWAVHDQEKLIRNKGDPDRTRHRRQEAFLGDVRALVAARPSAQDETPAPVLRRLLQAIGRTRRTAVARILKQAGWTW